MLAKDPSGNTNVLERDDNPSSSPEGLYYCRVLEGICGGKSAGVCLTQPRHLVASHDSRGAFGEW